MFETLPFEIQTKIKALLANDEFSAAKKIFDNWAKVEANNRSKLTPVKRTHQSN